MDEFRQSYILRLLILIAAVWMSLPALGQTLLYSQYDHEFRTVGIATNGTIVVLTATRHENAAVYEFTGTNAAITFLHHLDSAGNGDSARMSRDGEWIAGEMELEEQNIASLWRRSQPDTIIIPDPLPDDNSRLTDVANTSRGPVVTGYGARGVYIWTPDRGMLPWVTNHQPFLSRLSIYRISGDGETFAGDEYLIRKQGDPLVIRAIVGTKTNYTYLSPRGSTNSSVFSISPNGRFISGYDNLHAVLWQDGKMRLLPFGKRELSFSDTVTDNGFAGGRGGHGVMIYDPRSRKGYPFTDWWAKRYPQTPLPGRIRRINDLYEHGGNLYCLLEMRDDELEETYSILAIAPIKGLPLAYLKNPKSGYNRLGRIPGWRVTQ